MPCPASGQPFPVLSPQFGPQQQWAEDGCWLIFFSQMQLLDWTHTVATAFWTLSSAEGTEWIGSWGLELSVHVTTLWQLLGPIPIVSAPFPQVQSLY